MTEVDVAWNKFLRSMQQTEAAFYVAQNYARATNIDSSHEIVKKIYSSNLFSMGEFYKRLEDISRHFILNGGINAFYVPEPSTSKKRARC